MDYFKDNYTRINYPIASDKTRGLRNAQLGGLLKRWRNDFNVYYSNKIAKLK